MILPTIVAISREVITTVPNSQREAMAALGATRWEVVRGAVLPYARSGIIGAIILGLGRALGETMAVTMVIGNAQNIPSRLFDQGQTIASKIATTFNEASIGLQTSALIYLGLILLVITIALNILARLLVRRVGSAGGPGMTAATPVMTRSIADSTGPARTSTAAASRVDGVMRGAGVRGRDRLRRPAGGGDLLRRDQRHCRR